MASLHAIYASTSGHTEYVVQLLKEFLGKNGVSVTMQKAEQAQPEDLQKGDVLLLASSTWNTGGPEGQLNPHMFALLNDRAASVQLHGKNVLLLGLGDERYRYTCRAADLLLEHVQTHGGTVIEPVLRIINEPYGQEATVEKWAASILPKLQ